ncbi:MAG: hypothetical protein QG657_2967 [Acidobacteriota bacterium]|nr:hypothetical protein [Acidobacteriota bacterium]
MQKKIFTILTCLFLLTISSHSQEDYLKIDTIVNPTNICQGQGGVLKIKITPRSDIKISSFLGFMIKLDDNANLSYPKVFFTASELDLQSKQENDTLYLELAKEIPIPFKVNGNSLIGKHQISGEVVFTAVFKDNWSLKTYQKFYADFISIRNQKDGKK